MTDDTFTPAQPVGMREALVSAQRIIERDFPNGQLAIDIRNALAQPSPVGSHGDGYCGCTERCRDRDNCQYEVKPVSRSSAETEHPMSQSLLRTQEIMRAETMKAKIAALAHRFWSVHPSTLDDLGLTREEFYASEMTKLLGERQPSAGNEGGGLIAELDRLRLKAFKSGLPADKDAYYGRLSIAFQRGEVVVPNEPQTSGVREALAELYEWCRGCNDFRIDSRLGRKVQSALAVTRPKLCTCSPLTNYTDSPHEPPCPLASHQLGTEK